MLATLRAMHLVKESAPEFEVIPDLDSAWSVEGSASRLAAVRKGAQALRERFASERPVLGVRSFELLTMAYPARFGFWGAARLPIPYVLVRHRAVLVQFRQDGELRNLLFNPTDVSQVSRAPYLAQQRERKAVLGRMFLRVHESLEPQLRRIGVTPEDIDYVAFDHFHLQDVRKLVGTGRGTPARFPRARLLTPRREWAQWEELHPLHSSFLIPDGKKGVPSERVVLTDHDLRLGDGVMLVRTPGHTAGHQTLFFKTATGVWAITENGISADNWSPHASRIPGIASRTQEQGLEVLPNLGTAESGLDQYNAMVLEKTLVDRTLDDASFLQILPSFEATASRLTPGVKPYMHPALSFGPLVLTDERAQHGWTPRPQPAIAHMV
ncbi:hypothetical protein [Hyalangium rubrum]|uniref:Uncharacterized protein n=1 Tax=Hyalangium rubrum TaxID=3103134 RepID=A0ABU5HKA0_9BACT|nr:hypothetical protein [Hyalangium sp. s54d21]MDY7232495.1 hypothetical protein [Hyalangium sp. s54d21]